MANGITENLKNGAILGGLLGAALLYGDKVRQPILDFLNSNIPEQYLLGGLAIPVIVIGVGAIVGYFIDKN